MTLNLTNWEYYTLILSYPFINTSTLVNISSRIKTPNVCELMDLNDYQIYKTQQSENSQIIDEFIKSNDIELLTKLNNNRKTHLQFSSYYLLSGAIFWNKLVPV
tara:strand:+ start:402 stop:713 length:312 start_codon:yes stop_codon:yes gene_type:complete